MDAWNNWYKRKEGVLEPEIPKLTELLERKKLTRVFDSGAEMEDTQPTWLRGD